MIRIAFLLAAAALAACGKSAPSCSDSDAITTMLQLAKKAGRMGSADPGEVLLVANNIRTEGERGNATGCTADLKLNPDNPRWPQMQKNDRGIHTYKWRVQYTTQLTDDGKPYITVESVEPGPY